MKMEILDVFGKTIRQAETTSVIFEITKENLLAGIYFLKLSSQNKIIVTAKLVVAD